MTKQRALQISALAFLLALTAGFFYFFHRDHEKSHDFQVLTRDEALIHQLSPESHSTSQYRESVKRTGASLTETLPPQLKLNWMYQPLNVGIHTASKSTPAIDDSGIYVGSDSSWFYALDFEGHLRWKFFAEGAKEGIHGTAALDQDRVYFGAYNGVLYALNKKDGALVWSIKLGTALGASPALLDGFLYVGVETVRPPDGFVAKIRATNGEINWVSPWMGEQDHSSPTINEKEGLVYSGANNGRLFAFDINTGKTRWKANMAGAVKSTSALIQDQLIVTSWAARVSSFDAKTGELQWNTLVQGKVRGSPTFVPQFDSIIIADEKSHIYAIRLSDGQTIWRVDTKISDLISSALAVKSTEAPDSWLAWIPCEQHTLCALKPADGTAVAKYDLKGRLTSVPVVFKNQLYLALNNQGGFLNYKPAP